MGSESLATALAAFQADLPTVEKNRTGEVSGTSKQGKPYSYTYKYADLADVSSVVLKAIGKHGLSFTSRPTTVDGKFGLAYSLLHVSGDREDGFFELRDDPDIQRVGGRITYARRYCLCAVTGVAAEEDTDARHDAQQAPKPRASRRKPEMPEVDKHGAATLAEQTRMVHGAVDGVERLATTPPDDPWLSVDENGERRAAGQLPRPIGDQPPKPGHMQERLPHLNAIFGHFNRLGVQDKAYRLFVTALLAGLEPGGLKTSTDLTEEQAKRVLEELSHLKDGPALAARKKAIEAELELAAADAV
jgi:hypothetical protein